MQLFLIKLIEDIIAFSLNLDINICVLISNAIKKKVFNCIIGIIKYYWPIKSLQYAKPIFFWLGKLSPPVKPFMDLIYNKSENFNNNYNIINKVNNEIS